MWQIPLSRGIMHIFVVTDGRWQICRLLYFVIKIQNKLKYNFSGSVSLLQKVAIVIE